MTTTYIVNSFAGAGGYTPPDETSHGSLPEARAEARRRLGLARLHRARRGGLFDEPGLVGVESWTEYPASDPRAAECGGVAIYREVPA